jgi:peptide/nickel transport system substrate-binding protein
MNRLRLASAGMMLAIIGMVAVPTVNAQRSAATQHPFYIIGNIFTGAPMNYYNTQGLPFGLMDAMTLGIVKNGVGNPNAAYPGLAKSWKLSKDGRTLTVNLQPKARWSDGQAVTSHDAVVSAEIGFVRGVYQGFFTGTVTAKGAHTVVYKQIKGAHYPTFTRSVLSQYIAPAHVFESLLPNDIQSTITASQYSGTDPALVQKQKDALNTMQALAKKINAFSMPQDVSAGPYVMTSNNPSEAILTPNKYFYNPKAVRVQQVIVRNYNNDNNTIWNYILGAQVYQATSGGLTPDVVKRMKAVPHNHYYIVPSTTSAALFFNESISPWNNVNVRRAIAYVIDRKKVQRTGEPVSGTWTQYPAGEVDSVVKAYMGNKLKQINKYMPNRAKATKLLQGAHFKKQGGKWYLPNGNQWKLTLWTINGFSDWIEAANEMQSELNSFGIDTDVQLEPSLPQMVTDRAAGKIAFGMIFGSAAGGPNSWFVSFRDALYGPNDGWNIDGGKLIYYPTTATGKGNFFGIPATGWHVKGYGNVNPGVVAYKLTKTSNRKQIKSMVQKLLAATNQYVPEITLWNYAQNGFVNDQYFTNYPIAKKNVVPAWTCSGYVPVVGCWQLLGFVKPK